MPGYHPGKKIVIVEDDPLLNHALCKTFANAGYQAQGAASFCEGLEASAGAALMVLDIGLPDGEGFTLCRKMQENGRIPVIFLTARDEEQGMLKAFDCGVDDYLVKPFPAAVLLKHAEAVLRRSEGSGTEAFCYQNLSINFARKQVSCQGKEIKLTAKEYLLLELLAQNRGRVVTRQMMLEQIWDGHGSYVEENTVNVALSRLRKKIEPDPCSPSYIKNVFGLGYTFGE